MHVTINQLKEWDACEDGFDRFMAGAGKDADPGEKVSLYDALDKGCEISDITWAISNLDLTLDQERDTRLAACAFARRVLSIFEKNTLRISDHKKLLRWRSDLPRVKPLRKN